MSEHVILFSIYEVLDSQIEGWIVLRACPITRFLQLIEAVGQVVNDADDLQFDNQ